MVALLRLARPLNCIMSAAGVAVGGLVAAGAATIGQFVVSVVVAAAAAASFTAGGNALNDIYDRATDAVNHPDRPLPSRSVTLAGAKGFVAVTFGIAAVLAAFVNVYALAMVALNGAMMFSYEASLKRLGGPGNVVIAYLVGSLFLFGGVSVYRVSFDPIARTGVLASLAFFATLGREITKDIEDMRGDVDRKTIPQRLGASKAGRLAATCLLAAVALSVLPLYFGLFGLGYAIPVALADGMFIYAALHSAAKPAVSQRVTK
ncbi:MAG TPA: UbiA family prenyltransferase, partial [Thermoplasmata archaeon]|nr:UbiA family prenyltransferase [Thermoplasmata archaeon]